MQTLRKIHFMILQNTKRLRTFSQPQENTIIPINKTIFQQASLRAFIRFKDAFEQLANNNKQKQIQVQLKGLNYLEITYGSGSFVLQAQSDSSTLFFTSPIGDQQRFYSNKDGHLLDQNLTRETQKFVGDVLLL